MTIFVKEVNSEQILNFLKKNPILSEQPEYLESLIDPDVIKNLLSKDSYCNDRIAYGVFSGPDEDNLKAMAGYAIVNKTSKIMDILYIDELFRNLGMATKLIEVAQVDHVVVNKKNIAAISLYKKLGIAYTWDDE